jgi:hypothetical protein
MECREGNASLTIVVLVADFSVLFEKWTYLPVWWNCQSFATRLAFLLVELETFRERIASLARELQDQIIQRVISTREATFGKVYNYAGRAGLGTWTGTAITGIACPPIAGIFAVGFVGAWCVGAGVAVASNTYHQIDRKRVKEFRANMEQLEARFPLLRQLHGYILEVHESE